jgi:hypothetical protein
MLQIFNVIISGRTLEQFCAMSPQEQKEFIKTHSNQQSDVLIDKFLSQPFVASQGCANCGELNNKIENPFKNGNISKRVSEEVEVGNENNSTSGNGKRRASKRRKDDKTA